MVLQKFGEEATLETKQRLLPSTKHKHHSCIIMTDTHLVTLVDKATSEYLVQTDWTVVLQICDTLNRENQPLGYAIESL